ncbi:MAG: hypothetical protein GX496_01815 [Firmicutes bacterium]|uniref:Secreted protein n=1 Tax=Geochorda subterranea TaxID=3109564 RepID=A0ABZ1BNN6_9FIRM|nr:hypothetical protein [Limnochorda sp. LNt]NLG68292.1 hypothetical protein [Bacillota bacterium]WRP14178.1 hypothetical protein VLY81_12250 [Limnochorda sp. LNt]
MRILFLVSSVLLILAVARRWDRLHPLRVAHRHQEARVASPSGGGAPTSTYLDLSILDRARASRRAWSHPVSAETVSMRRSA